MAICIQHRQDVDTLVAAVPQRLGVYGIFAHKTEFAVHAGGHFLVQALASQHAAADVAVGEGALHASFFVHDKERLDIKVLQEGEGLPDAGMYRDRVFHT